jgi:hypothetical protein
LTITGTVLGSPVNATVSVEPVSVIPTQAGIGQLDEVYAFVPAGASVFNVSLTGRARVEARAQSAGLFGTITGAATAIADFPNSLRIGRITRDDGRPLPSGTSVRGLNSQIYYEGVALSVAGPASFALDTLRLHTTPVPSAGLIFMGRATLLLPFGDGLRCIAGPTYRFPLQNAGANGIAIGPGIVAYSAAHLGANAIAPGDTWHFQAWYRDGAGPCGSGANTSNALSVTFYP